MEKLFLEELSIKRKEEAIDYCDEIIKNGDKFNGTSSLEDYINNFTYEESVKNI